MKTLKRDVEVKIEFFTGQDEGDTGTPYYVASCNDLMFTTDGETFEKLLLNIQECLALNLRDTDSAAEFGVSPDANIRLTMDLHPTYARSA